MKEFFYPELYTIIIFIIQIKRTVLQNAKEEVLFARHFIFVTSDEGISLHSPRFATVVETLLIYISKCLIHITKQRNKSK